MIIKYFDYKDRNELINSINNLETIYKKELMREKSLYYEDMFLISAIDKSIKLIDSFLYALQSNNITVLAVLTRVQIDCVLRTFGCAISNDSSEYAKKGLNGKLEARKEFDKNKNGLTDKYLCQELKKIFKYPIYELYQKTSSAIHLSSLSFHNIVKAEKESNIEYDYEVGKISMKKQIVIFNKLV